jgi:hypothetical protein
MVKYYRLDNSGNILLEIYFNLVSFRVGINKEYVLVKK